MKLRAILRLLPEKLLTKLLCLILSFSLLTSIFYGALPRETSAAAQDDLATLTQNLKTKNDEVKNSPAVLKPLKVSEIKNIAKTRRDKLKDIMQTKPAEVGKYLIENRDDFVDDVRGDIEIKVDQAGILREGHIDKKDGTEEKFFLFDGMDLSVPAKFAVTFDKHNIHPSRLNTSVTISGFTLDNQLWFPASENTQLATATDVSAAAGPGGDRKIGYYYVTFTDNRTRGISDADLDSFINLKFKNFISDSSSGRLNIINAIHNLDLDVNKTCELINIFGITDRNGALIKAVYNKARQQGINPDEDDDRIIILDPTVSCGDWSGYSLLGPGWAYSIGTNAIAHEFGHNMWLGHAQTWDCGFTVIEADCQLKEYGNFTDVMGNHDILDDNDYGGYAKHYLGWLGAGELIDLDISRTGGVYSLSRFEKPGDGTPRVLRIKTFVSGPSYYIQYRQKGDTRFLRGPTVELASGSLGQMNKTRLIDMTPSSQIGLADFNDGYITDGQEFNDPFNGIVVRSVSRDSTKVMLEVSYYQGSSGGTLSVSWSQPIGYVTGSGQKLDLSWANALYMMSHRCLTGYACDPSKWTDEPVTVAHNGQFLIASSNLGYSYEYRVMILTKDDSNPNQLAYYPWVDPTTISNDCNGADTCQAAIFWPQVTYRATLTQKSDGQPACVTRFIQGVDVGCQDAIMIGEDNTSLTFKGLPADITLAGQVHVNDKLGALHLLQDFPNLGKSQTYTNSCTGGNGCLISGPSGIGPYIGHEPLVTGIRKDNINGVLIRGPEFNLAYANGSFGYSSWDWDYYIEVYPNNFGTCAGALGQCQKQWINGSVASNFDREFDGLLPGTNYKVRVCVKQCGGLSGNSVIVDRVIPSSTVGPIFFASDPFDRLSHGFLGKYFDYGSTGVKLTRFDPVIRFSWGNGSPDPSINPINFSVKWEEDIDFTQDVYRFVVMSDSDIHVYVDGVSIINRKTPGVWAIAKAMDFGSHHIEVDYSHGSGTSYIYFAAVPAYGCYDQNGDGKINSTDLGIIAQHFNVRGITPWDVNGNQNVNSTDLMLVAKKFNTTCQ